MEKVETKTIITKRGSIRNTLGLLFYVGGFLDLISIAYTLITDFLEWVLSSSQPYLSPAFASVLQFPKHDLIPYVITYDQGFFFWLAIVDMFVLFIVGHWLRADKKQVIIEKTETTDNKDAKAISAVEEKK
ncbi:MAG: hypothetical protein NTY48_00590 [Candidatus Diapherotrites archaeon]|nr:hypothetical protein [Candidatus Diapherotrites archaeon]